VTKEEEEQMSIIVNDLSTSCQFVSLSPCFVYLADHQFSVAYCNELMLTSCFTAPENVQLLGTVAIHNDEFVHYREVTLYSMFCQPTSRGGRSTLYFAVTSSTRWPQQRLSPVFPVHFTFANVFHEAMADDYEGTFAVDEPRTVVLLTARKSCQVSCQACLTVCQDQSELQASNEIVEDGACQHMWLRFAVHRMLACELTGPEMVSFEGAFKYKESNLLPCLQSSALLTGAMPCCSLVNEHTTFETLNIQCPARDDQFSKSFTENSCTHIDTNEAAKLVSLIGFATRSSFINYHASLTVIVGDDVVEFSGHIGERRALPVLQPCLDMLETETEQPRILYTSNKSSTVSEISTLGLADCIAEGYKTRELVARESEPCHLLGQERLTHSGGDDSRNQNSDFTTVTVQPTECVLNSNDSTDLHAEDTSYNSCDLKTEDSAELLIVNALLNSASLQTDDTSPNTDDIHVDNTSYNFAELQVENISLLANTTTAASNVKCVAVPAIFDVSFDADDDFFLLSNSDSGNDMLHPYCDVVNMDLSPLRCSLSADCCKLIDYMEVSLSYSVINMWHAEPLTVVCSELEIVSIVSLVFYTAETTLNSASDAEQYSCCDITNKKRMPVLCGLCAVFSLLSDGTEMSTVVENVQLHSETVDTPEFELCSNVQLFLHAPEVLFNSYSDSYIEMQPNVGLSLSLCCLSMDNWTEFCNAEYFAAVVNVQLDSITVECTKLELNQTICLLFYAFEALSNLEFLFDICSYGGIADTKLVPLLSIENYRLIDCTEVFAAVFNIQLDSMTMGSPGFDQSSVECLFSYVPESIILNSEADIELVVGCSTNDMQCGLGVDVSSLVEYTEISSATVKVQPSSMVVDCPLLEFGSILYLFFHAAGTVLVGCNTSLSIITSTGTCNEYETTLLEYAGVVDDVHAVDSVNVFGIDNCTAESDNLSQLELPLLESQMYFVRQRELDNVDTHSLCAISDSITMQLTALISVSGQDDQELFILSDSDSNTEVISYGDIINMDLSSILCGQSIDMLINTSLINFSAFIERIQPSAALVQGLDLTPFVQEYISFCVSEIVSNSDANAETLIYCDTSIDLLPVLCLLSTEVCTLIKCVEISVLVVNLLPNTMIIESTQLELSGALRRLFHAYEDVTNCVVEMSKFCDFTADLLCMCTLNIAAYTLVDSFEMFSFVVNLQPNTVVVECPQLELSSAVDLSFRALEAVSDYAADDGIYCDIIVDVLPIVCSLSIDVYTFIECLEVTSTVASNQLDSAVVGCADLQLGSTVCVPLYTSDADVEMPIYCDVCTINELLPVAGGLSTDINTFIEYFEIFISVVKVQPDITVVECPSLESMSASCLATNVSESVLLTWMPDFSCCTEYSDDNFTVDGSTMEPLLASKVAGNVCEINTVDVISGESYCSELDECLNLERAQHTFLTEFCLIRESDVADITDECCSMLEHPVKVRMASVTLLCGGAREEGNSDHVLVLLSNFYSKSNVVETLCYSVLLNLGLAPVLHGRSIDILPFINCIEVSASVVNEKLAVVLTECPEMEFVPTVSLSCNMLYSTEDAETHGLISMLDLSDINCYAVNECDADSLVMFSMKDTCCAKIDDCSDLNLFQCTDSSFTESCFVQWAFTNADIEDSCSVLEEITVHVASVTVTNEEDCYTNDGQALQFNEALQLLCSSWCYVDSATSLTYQSDIRTTLVSRDAWRSPIVFRFGMLENL
jgi:hypothetical protein